MNTLINPYQGWVPDPIEAEHPPSSAARPQARQGGASGQAQP